MEIAWNGTIDISRVRLYVSTKGTEEEEKKPKKPSNQADYKLNCMNYNLIQGAGVCEASTRDD